MQSQTEDLHGLFLRSCVSGFESGKQFLVHMFRSSNPTSYLVHMFLGSNPTNKFIYFCVRIWPATSSSHLSGFEPGQQRLVHMFLCSNAGRSLAHVFLCSNLPSNVHFTNAFFVSDKFGDYSLCYGFCVPSDAHGKKEAAALLGETEHV